MQTRPTYTNEMKRELAEVIGKDVYEWCNQNDQSADLDECVDAVEKVCRYSWSSGFELSKDLEDKLGINPNAELVEIMENVDYEKGKIVEKYVKKWVIDNNIQPELTEGTRVKTMANRKDVEGEIVEVYKDIAKYGVCVESMGQVKGKSHYVVESETCSILNPSTV